MNTIDPRAPECDTEAREATIDRLIAFILIRHGAWQSAAQDNPRREIYLQARDNAVTELTWRIKSLWHDCELHERRACRLHETLDALRAVMKDREGYETHPKPPALTNPKLFW